MDLLIKNGTIVTAKGSYMADVAVKDGKIAEIGKNIDVSADKVVDANGKLVLPGAIDVHTHLAMPFGGTVSADSYLSGTRAAACGGVTTVLIIPFSTAERQLWDLSIQKRLCLKRRLVLIMLFIVALPI